MQLRAQRDASLGGSQRGGRGGEQGWGAPGLPASHPCVPPMRSPAVRLVARSHIWADMQGSHGVQRGHEKGGNDPNTAGIRPSPPKREPEWGRGRCLQRGAAHPPHLPLHPQNTPAPRRRPAVGTTATSCACMSSPRANASPWVLRSASLRVRSSRAPGHRFGCRIRPSILSLQRGEAHAGLLSG